ncbi:MAG: M48 family metallopeptidase [Chitinophagales bacterium]|nr:M48 family metallopeptidase [Chitinophagales bacterium]
MKEQVLKRDKFHFGSTEIVYNTFLKERKSIGITVRPDQSILVTSPLHISSEKVKELVKKKAPWIIKQQSYFLSFHPLTPPRRYVGGETHLYLGRQYRLKLVESKKEEVKMKGAFIFVYTKKKENKKQVKQLMNEWYRINANEKFEKYFAECKKLFHRQDLKEVKIQLRNMPKRWGSCTVKGKIILNPELIKAPRGCIEYVLIHELCHTKFANHSNAFFHLQSQMMSDWEKWKSKLEKVMS